jgi:hypothetical protein
MVTEIWRKKGLAQVNPSRRSRRWVETATAHTHYSRVAMTSAIDQIVAPRSSHASNFRCYQSNRCTDGLSRPRSRDIQRKASRLAAAIRRCNFLFTFRLSDIPDTAQAS